MSERYSRLFSLEPNQYSEGSPVLISAGALLKDNITGQILAQLKFKNISPKTIKAVKVTVCPQDAAGRPLGSRVEHQYLDLTASRDVEFGQKEAIPMPDLSTRAFSVSVSEVVLSDNSIYSGTGKPFVLPDFVPLEKSLNNPELRKQFTIECGAGCYYVPQAVLNLWYCTCGQINHSHEAVCHKCGRAFAQLSRAIDSTYLTAATNKRLAEEAEAAARAQAEAEARAKAEAEERERQEAIRRENAARRAKRNKRIAAILAVIAVLAGACYVVINIVIPNNKYNDAVALMNEGKYAEALAVFEELKGYKDSSEQAVAAYKEQLKRVKVGEYIFFGEYEQDNDMSNGKEDIEWQVLAVEDGKALVISKYCLDCIPYNNDDTFVEWGECTLRTWMHYEFFTSAFSTGWEKTMIRRGAKEDLVFILHEEEIRQYLDETSARGIATAYAKGQGGDVSAYWVRPARTLLRAYIVRSDGTISDRYHTVTDKSIAVRPAMWIDLNA